VNATFKVVSTPEPLSLAKVVTGGMHSELTDKTLNVMLMKIEALRCIIASLAI
jgi:hypothetical protein